MKIIDGGTMAARVAAALRGLFVGDAIAMPAHWFYRPSDICTAFPPDGVRGLEPAPARHPGAIMPLHSTSNGGRRSVERGDVPQVVGDIILKGRRHRWLHEGIHYHHGLPAGETTLNSWCARWLLEDLVAHGGVFSLERWLRLYEKQMTADPPAYPDTYAESYHRGFFYNRMMGKPLLACGAVTHDTASIGVLVTMIPLVVLGLAMGRPVEEVHDECQALARSTHPDDAVERVTSSFVALVDALFNRSSGPDKEELARLFARAVSVARMGNILPFLRRRVADGAVVGGAFSPACYLEGSWPSVCFFAARYPFSPTEALLANTNVGGDNVHRGAVLGALLGLVNGAEISTPWWQGMARRDELDGIVQSAVRLVRGSGELGNTG